MENLSAQSGAFLSQITIRQAVSQIEPSIQLRLWPNRFFAQTISMHRDQRASISQRHASLIELVEAIFRAANEQQPTTLNNRFRKQSAVWLAMKCCRSRRVVSHICLYSWVGAFIQHPSLSIFGLAPATAHGILSKTVQRLSADGTSKLANPDTAADTFIKYHPVVGKRGQD